jgi:hypothetical protein
MNLEEEFDARARESQSASAAQQVSDDRREALRRIGKYTAYVAPAMLALVSTRNHAIS